MSVDFIIVPVTMLLLFLTADTNLEQCDSENVTARPQPDRGRVSPGGTKFVSWGKPGSHSTKSYRGQMDQLESGIFTGTMIKVTSNRKECMVKLAL